MTAVVMALGSNQPSDAGTSAKTVRAAISDLATLDGLSQVRASTLVQSTALTPEGPNPAEPPYVNAVVCADWSGEPRALLDALLAIESDYGRVRTQRWGPRTLDIDIVTVDGLSSDDPALTLPHPEAHRRDFVLVPWLELDADATLPGHGRVADLVATLAAGTLGLVPVEVQA